MSEQRVECVHASTCAGCPAIDAPYEVQLREKGARVDRALARFVALGSIVRAEVRGAERVEGYRTRVKLVVEGTKVGLFARSGDHVVVDIPECRVMSKDTARAVALIRDRLRESEALRRALVAVDVRDVRTDRDDRDDRERALLVTLVLDEGARVAAELEARRLHELAREGDVPIATVALSTRPSRSPLLLGRGLRVVVGPEVIDERVEAPGGRHVAIPAVPGGFVQAHAEQASRLRAHVVDELARQGIAIEGARVIDAYAGSGALGLGLAAAGARVLLIESYEPAMRLARDAAERQGLRVKAVASDAAEALRELSRRGDRPDVIVLNPPRRGVAPEVRQAVAGLAPRRVVYVSCEPDTLARDLDHLARLGYATDSLVPFDLIPLSREVESVVVLAPRVPTPLPVLARADGIALVAFPAREPDAFVHAQEAAGFEGVVLGRWGSEGGVLALARDDVARAWATSIPSAEVIWQALVRGVARAKGSVSRAVNGVEARTRYKRLAVIGGHSLLEVRSEPADDAVIAQHLGGLGHPVLGAAGGHVPSNRHFTERYALDRPFVGVARIAITTPEGTRLEVEVPRPGDLATVLARLEAGSVDAD
ncbi:MAG: RsmD family RNA methyltransferase [Myxococcota bacterium]|jgi:23S rRNA (uracil1939-C5)-methyltransferase|nr:RsmD family RNA methyltransferase [Myxococcota bacterium]